MVRKLPVGFICLRYTILQQSATTCIEEIPISPIDRLEICETSKNVAHGSRFG